MANTKSSQPVSWDRVDEQTALLADSARLSLPSPENASATSGGTETTVLGDNRDHVTDDNDDDDDDDKPLPKTQLLLLCYARTVEPMVFYGIFPFVTKMVQDIGQLEEADIGFYSGLIESLFSLTQMVVMIFWGRLSDRIGRKPVLTVSLFAVSIAAVLFGFSRTLWQMIVFRCLAGAFAGSIVTVRTMTAELSTKCTQARVFSYFAFAGNIANFIGPLIGGALADPAEQYGGPFKRIAFFQSYPYALATLTIGGVVFSSAVTTLFFINETKKSFKPSTASPDTITKPSQEPQKIRDLLRYPGIGMVLYIYGYSSLLGIAFTSIIPVFWYTRSSLGGFGFNPFMISVYMALTGFSQAIWLLVVFPPLHKRLGTGGILRLCGTAYPFVYLQMPFLNLLLKTHNQAATVVFWILSPILMATSVGVSMVFTAIQLAVNDVSPSTETLGTVNSLALTLSSGIRAFGPWMFTSIFAVGARTQVLGGYLIWAVLVVIGSIYAFSVRVLPERAAGSGTKR